jgi:hypothetical protein
MKQVKFKEQIRKYHTGNILNVYRKELRHYYDAGQNAGSMFFYTIDEGSSLWYNTNMFEDYNKLKCNEKS